MSRSLTADEATELMRQRPGDYVTTDQLRTLAGRVDANPTGRLTVLYSGQTAPGIKSEHIIEGMLEAGEDVRVINRSEAAAFLQSDEFYNAVAKAYGLPDFKELTENTYRGPATDWLYDPKDGPWADVSGRFVDATRGEVRVVGSGATPDRTFGEVELPRALANPEITTIEGIPRAALQQRPAAALRHAGCRCGVRHDRCALA